MKKKKINIKIIAELLVNSWVVARFNFCAT